MRNLKLGKYRLAKCKSIIFSAALIFCTACGDTTSNDQGVSFTFLGWFRDSTGTAGASGFVSPLSAGNSETGGEVTEVLGFVGMQNHLNGQTVRAQRVYHEYTIPGSRINIPSTAVALGTVLAPGGAATTTGGTTGGNTGGNAGGAAAGAATKVDPTFNSESTLPGSHFTGNSIRYAQLPVVTAAIRSFLNLNRNELPELPFVMIVRSYIQGTTSAGREIISNDNEVEVLFTEDTPIAPTDGSDGTDAGAIEEENFDEFSENF